MQLRLQIYSLQEQQNFPDNKKTLDTNTTLDCQIWDFLLNREFKTNSLEEQIRQFWTIDFHFTKKIKVSSMHIRLPD